MTDFLSFTPALPDIIIAAVVLLLMIIGYIKGFMRSAVKLLSLAASVVLAWLLWPIVADLLGNLWVKALFAESAETGLSRSLAGMTSSAETLPLAVRNMLEAGQQAVADGIAGIAASVAINIIAFIIVLLVSRLTIAIAAKLLNVFSELPVISFFNRVAGALFGALEGTAIVLIVLAVIYAFVPLGSGTKTENAIENSVVAKHLYENNPIIGILNLKTADGGNNGE